MSDSSNSSLPQVSPRYQIKETPLGRGGMGIVYKAYDTVTKRYVAVKTMWGDIDPGAIELFEREWSVLARLSHPNIVDILDTGEFRENGQRKPYFVMPLLPGFTLDYLIKNLSHRMTVERVVEIIVQACKGLQAAHEQNLVHRDLKPSNIFVMEDDTAKIIDFGVVHLADARSVTGIKGTLQYMAPEQLEMKPATALSDIFSLAVVCYEALTTRKPFARKTEGDTAEAIRTYIPPPASEFNPSVNQMVSRTVHKAMAKQPWHRFSSAREFADTLQKALRNEPIERFDRSKIQPRIERIKRAYSEGDYQFAMEILTELESEGNIDPDMSVLRIQIEQGLRQKTIRQLLESARTRMEEDEHPLALQKIGEVLSIDPNNVDALSLKSQIERQRSEKQINGWLRLVNEHRENHLYSQARQCLQEILKIDARNAAARQQLEEIDQAEQEVTKLREEKQRLYDGALTSYKNGEISSALTKLERVLELTRRTGTKSPSPDLDAQYQSFYNQVRSERDAARNAYAEGRKCLLDRNIARTLEICEENLQKQPGDPMFQALKLEAEEMQRQEQSSAIAEMSRRVDEEADLDKKYNLIKEAVERFPQEPHFKSSLKLIRDRRDLVNSIIGRARQYEERGQFTDAANQWDILRNIYPLYPGLDFEVERLVRRTEEHAQSEIKARWMERIDGHFGAGEYAHARAVIKEALIEFPGDKELQGLESLAEQGVRRSAEANVLLAQGKELCAGKNYPEGLEALRRAERLDPRNSAARAALLSALVEYARDLINQDWRSSEPLIEEAAALNASDPVVRSLVSLLESNRRQEDIGNILVEARNLQAAGEIRAALEKVEQGLVTYPNEQRLSQLHNTLQNLAGPAPALAKAAVDAGAERVASDATQIANFSATSVQPVSKIVQPPAQASAAPVRPDIKKAPDRSSQVEPTPGNKLPPPAKPPKPPKQAATGALGPVQKMPPWMIGAGAAAVLLLIGAVLVLSLRKKEVPSPPRQTPTFTVQLSANVPNAKFTLDNKPVSGSVQLAPGDHTGEASLDGYVADARSFHISNAPLTVAFTLRPALPELRISSGIRSGSLILDDDPATALQEGAFTKDDIPMGDHTVKILDGLRPAFSFGFHAEPKQIITLTGPLTDRQGQGLVVSSLGGAALIYGTPGMKGALAGQPLKAIPANGLDVPAANPPQQVSLDDGSGKLRDLTADSSPLPVITVLLNGAAEKFTLTVRANVPDAVLVLNGQALKRHFANGARTVNLDPGTYTVKIAQDGYQDSDEQRLVVKSGDKEKTLQFTLNPVQVAVKSGTLVISSAPPEAEVYLDDMRWGTVNASGSFTKDLSPGPHTLRLHKSGYEDFKISHEFKAAESFHPEAKMAAAMGTLALKVTPGAARITVKGPGDTISTLPNGTSAPMHAGSYVITADLEGYLKHEETVQVENGKVKEIDWTLEKPTITRLEGPNVFEDSKAWKKDESNWWVHGGGVALIRANGTYIFDILKRKGGGPFSHVKRINMVADFKGPGDYVSWSLDGKNFIQKTLIDGKGSPEQKTPHGMEGGDSMRIVVEITNAAITIKNKAGVTLDTVKRSGNGKFGFVDEVTLAVH